VQPIVLQHVPIDLPCVQQIGGNMQLQLHLHIAMFSFCCAGDLQFSAPAIQNIGPTVADK